MADIDLPIPWGDYDVWGVKLNEALEALATTGLIPDPDHEGFFKAGA